MTATAAAAYPTSALIVLALFQLVPRVGSADGVRPFQLPGSRGEVVEIAASDGEMNWTVVCFLGAECPLAKLYGPRLQQTADDYASRQVRFIGVNSNRQDSADDVREYVRRHGVEFPVAKDHGNVVADQFGAKRTPEVFVLDRQLRVRYRGRIDDQYTPGVARAEATRHDLRQALDELLAGRPVSLPRTEAVGCHIGREKHAAGSGDVTFCNQVSRILRQHCVECHRPGEIGPFALTNYEEVVGWADMMLEVVDEGRMPPWHADPDHGQFRNARNMPAADKVLLRRWADSGTPYGDPANLPEPLEFTDGWQLSREPDVILPMNDRPFDVPAEGTVEYQYFVVDPGFEEDQWITGAEVIPGNRSVVHHSIVFVRPPDGARFRGIGWLAAYVPGQRAADFPSGHAIRVPAKSKLVFQQHYTPTGTRQSDITKVGLLLGDEREITHEVYTLIGINQEFEIPPHAADHVVQADVPRLPDHADLLAIMPHMHLRGKSFRAVANRGEEAEVLLDVPRYDFNWQHIYRLVKPLPLAELDALEFTAVFDNSAANPANPDPSQRVTWGDQTWEEMAVAFFEVAQPLDRERQATRPATSAQVDANNVQQVESKVTRITRAFLDRFDANRDGEVGRFETPLAFRRFGFRDSDRDGDGILTRTEIEQAARERVRN